MQALLANEFLTTLLDDPASISSHDPVFKACLAEASSVPIIRLLANDENTPVPVAALCAAELARRCAQTVSRLCFLPR